MTDRARPWLAAFDGDLVICDAPIVVGLSAIGRQEWLATVLPAIAYVTPARLEINEMWVGGIPGADTATSGAMREILATDSGDRAVRDELFLQVDALATMWTGEGMTDAAARSAATAFVAARHRGVPLMSHRRPITRAATPRGGAKRIACFGAAELTLWLSREHLTPPEAWDMYQQLATTICGEQWLWAVGADEDEFGYWAAEAAAARL